jgi:hypothetical protein
MVGSCLFFVRYSRMLLKLGKYCKQYMGIPVKHPLCGGGGSSREKKLYLTGHRKVNLLVVVMVVAVMTAVAVTVVVVVAAMTAVAVTVVAVTVVAAVVAVAVAVVVDKNGLDQRMLTFVDRSMQFEENCLADEPIRYYVFQ